MNEFEVMLHQHAVPRLEPGEKIEASGVLGSFTSAELSLIERSGYARRSLGGYDLLVPQELVDSYAGVIEAAAPQLFAP